MTFKIQVVIADGEQQETLEEIITLDKETERVGHIGLRVVESKDILRGLQEVVVQAQTNTYLQQRRPCPHCGSRRGTKGHHWALFRTLFGNVRLRSPRLYHCPCEEHPAKSFSPLTDLLTEHTAPELLYLETKWASLAPYAKVADLLKDVLPVSKTLSGVTIRGHLQKVAERTESALGEEQVCFADGCPASGWAELPRPDGPITVGIDGGYVRERNEKNTHFEVIAGKSVLTDRPAKRFAFANGYDEKPKRRLFEMLRAQGLQMNQQITFLSDGADSVRRLQRYLSPQAEHLLDWFHLTMRITVLRQYAKGLVKIDEEIGTEIKSGLGSLKWYLWHGNVYEALLELDIVEMLIYNFEDTYPKFKKLERFVREFHTYIERNRNLIPNYGERWRNGERISTGFVESTINQVVAKRFCKRQQMQWTRRGAHLLLQTRTHVLNDELASRFREWYPDFSVEEQNERQMAA